MVAGSRADIGRAGLGRSGAQGAPKPDISSVEAFRRTLLASKAVAFPGKGASGIVFCQPTRSHGHQGGDARQAQADGGGRHCRGGCSRRGRHVVVVVATRIWTFQASIGSAQFPRNCRRKSALRRLSSSTKQPDAAKALIRFLTAPSAAATLRSKGVDPNLTDPVHCPLLPAPAYWLHSCFHSNPARGW